MCSNLLNLKMGIFFFRFFFFILLYEACGSMWLMLFLHRTELMNGETGILNLFLCHPWDNNALEN